MNKECISRVINLAQNEIGYIEKASNSELNDKAANAGSRNFTKYADMMDSICFYNGKKNGQPWCAVFYDWLFVTTFGLEIARKVLNRPLNSLSASCKYAKQYYSIISNSPVVGSQVFFKNSSGVLYHTGIVIKVEKDAFIAIEGNTSTTNFNNGDRVLMRKYNNTDNKIDSFGIPNWHFVEDMEGDNMTQDKFNEMFTIAFANHQSKLRDNSANEYSKEAREWAISNNIIQGGDSTNSEANYMWRDLITREQMIVLLHRFKDVLECIMISTQHFHEIDYLILLLGQEGVEKHIVLRKGQ